MSLPGIFFATASISTSTAAFNLLCTVLLVRWFGAGVYANYLVDLSYLSLLLILLEVVPSNYSIFRLQDEPTRIRGLAALAVASAFMLDVLLLCQVIFLICSPANSVWIAPYAGAMAIKRYLDIRLQSSGRLREYFGIELLGSIIRVALMAVFLWCCDATY